MKTKLIIFDYDGVILPSVHFHKKIWEEHIVKGALDFDFFARCHEGNIYAKQSHLTDTEAALMKNIQDGFKNYISYIQDEYPQISFDETTNNILEKLSLKLSEIPFVIVSSGQETLIHKNLEYNKARNLFEEKIYGKVCSPSKVEKFNMVFEDFKVDAKDCLFITDTLGDVREANERGIPTLGIAGGMHDEGTLRRGEIIGYIQSLEDLIKYI